MKGGTENMLLTMELFQTDANALMKFVDNEVLEGEFSENYLILYNFAEDCYYHTNFIQPDLIKHLLPFYYKTIECAIRNKNSVALQIYCSFNSVIMNQKAIIHAIGDEQYQQIMEYYIEETIRYMEKGVHFLDWVGLFNTTVALNTHNISRLFEKIFNDSASVKYSFFRYLSVLLFVESDNLLIKSPNEQFWSNCIWSFDSWLSDDFFWNNSIVEVFNEEIDSVRIEALLKDIEPLLHNDFESEIVNLISDEVNKSLISGIFCNRKSDFLRKMNGKDVSDRYWNSY